MHSLIRLTTYSIIDSACPNTILGHDNSARKAKSLELICEILIGVYRLAGSLRFVMPAPQTRIALILTETVDYIRHYVYCYHNSGVFHLVDCIFRSSSFGLFRFYIIGFATIFLVSANLPYPRHFYVTFLSDNSHFG